MRILQWVVFVLFLNGCAYETLQQDAGDDDMKWQRSAGRQLTTQQSQLVPLLQTPLPEEFFYTAQFYVNQASPTNAPSAPYQAVATINFTQGGIQVQRRVSLFNGQSISGSGESIDIKVQDFTPVGAAFPLPGTPYNVGVVVTKGTRANFWVPPTLIATGVLSGVGTIFTGTTTLTAGGQQASYNVPPDAGVSSVEVVQANIVGIGATQMRVDHLSAAGNLLKSYDPQIQNRFVPLAPGTVQVVVTNLGVANNGLETLTWGIDG